MQSVLFKIWIRVAVSISYDDNHYTTGTSSVEDDDLKVASMKQSIDIIWIRGRRCECYDMEVTLMTWGAGKVADNDETWQKSWRLRPEINVNISSTRWKLKLAEKRIMKVARFIILIQVKKAWKPLTHISSLIETCNP